MLATDDHQLPCGHFELGVVKRYSSGACALCVIERSKNWRAQNRERKSAVNKRWARANPDKVQASRERWNARNGGATRAAQKRWKQYNPERVREQAGMVFDDGQTIASMRLEQSHCCAICGCDLSKLIAKRVVVDHDHAIADGSPNVRAILCSHCNHVLGHAKDSPAILRLAADYLERHTQRRSKS